MGGKRNNFNADEADAGSEYAVAVVVASSDTEPTFAIIIDYYLT